MKFSKIIPIGALSVFLLFFSCASSSSTYVADAIGWSVTKGDVLKVFNLNSRSNEVLSDGVAITISEPGCKVTIQLEDKTRTFDLCVDSILIFGDDSDYILLPCTRSPEVAGSSQ